MKNLILTVVLFIVSTICLSAQSREPAQVPLKYDGTTDVMFQSDSVPFLQNTQFLVGFHWDNNSEISKAILANQNNAKATYLNNDTFQMQDSRLLVIEGIHKLPIERDNPIDYLYKSFNP